MWVNIQRITGVAHCANVVWPDLDYPPIKCTGIPKQVINVRLLVSPQLGRSMLTEGINKAIGMEHRGIPFMYGQL
jgi:hypothetical protein